MQARTVLALATLAAVPLAAQRSHQFEFGAFGSFTRYDRAFNLGNQIVSATSSASTSGSSSTPAISRRARRPGPGQRS